MKYLILSMLAIVSFSASAASFKACEIKAEKVISKKSRYKGEEVTAYDCDLAPNRAVVICEVAANKGDGAATDTWKVVLSRDCSEVYEMEMIGEE